jgi:hypothetical protein
MKALSKTEFDRWIAAYPRKLQVDVCATVEPPLVTWNDFERAPYWPDSIVARHVEGDFTYNVIEDINAPVVTKRKPDLEPLFDQDGAPVQIGDTIRVEWGWDDKTGDIYKTHTVLKRDVGTPYERWGMSGCYNHLRGMTFTKISDAANAP